MLVEFEPSLVTVKDILDAVQTSSPEANIITKDPKELLFQLGKKFNYFLCELAVKPLESRKGDCKIA